MHLTSVTGVELGRAEDINVIPPLGWSQHGGDQGSKATLCPSVPRLSPQGYLLLSAHTLGPARDGGNTIGWHASPSTQETGSVEQPFQASTKARGSDSPCCQRPRVSPQRPACRSQEMEKTSSLLSSTRALSLLMVAGGSPGAGQLCRGSRV